MMHGKPHAVDIVAFAPTTGRLATALDGADHIEMWRSELPDKGLRREEGIFPAHDVHSIAFSADGQTVAYASENGDVVLLDVNSWKEVLRLRSFSNRVEDAGIPNDLKVLAVQLWYDRIVKWDLEDGAPDYKESEHRIPETFWSQKGHTFNRDISISNRKDSVVLSDRGGGIIATIVLLDKIDGWVVVAPDGRFDTNINLDEISGVHWVMSENAFDPLPLEIFMRDYYEPRLLPRLLAGEEFPSIRPVSELNRAQPKVQVVRVERETGPGSSGDTVSVTVEVSGSSEAFALEGKKQRESGAYDLRLFRDGQLVGKRPTEAGEGVVAGSSAEDELGLWRKQRLVVDQKEGKREVVFPGIRLPRKAGVKDVQFSAYAFNEDRVKSETARRPFAIPAELSPRVPRAYIVSVGVNAFEDRARDLSYAANDAKQLGEALKVRLEAQRDERGQARYEKVVWVGLTSEVQDDPQGQRKFTHAQASKAKIRAVLQTLAGQTVKPEELNGLDNAQELGRVNPEDLVIIALSTHGEVDDRGRFYLLPQDIGSNPSRQQRLERAISNDELSEWLQGVDAIDLAMIVDACHSAASVQNKEFKPGPMGSRGLGQLAYDKGMRILAATQIDQYALETQKTQLGLLSYALVRDGLDRGKADYKPKDQQIFLSEWLSYASERVPGLYQDWREGKLKGTKKGEILAAPEQHPGETRSLQQPALFDFARGRDVSISRQTDRK